MSNATIKKRRSLNSPQSTPWLVHGVSEHHGHGGHRGQSETAARVCGLPWDTLVHGALQGLQHWAVAALRDASCRCLVNHVSDTWRHGMGETAARDRQTSESQTWLHPFPAPEG